MFKRSIPVSEHRLGKSPITFPIRLDRSRDAVTKVESLPKAGFSKGATAEGLQTLAVVPR
jgi:hypothetical protein